MKRFLIALAAIAVVAAASTVYAQLTPGTQGILVPTFFTSDGTSLTPNPSTLLFSLPGLASEDCIGTDSNGLFQSGTCTGGSSFAYPFPSNATSTELDFSGGLTAASTTVSGTTTTNGLNVTGSANFFGTIGSALSDFCVAITGGSGLCDGTDATGSGTGNVGTSTTDTDTYVTYFTSNGATPALIGGEAAFTYDDATNRLTAENASTSITTANSALFGGTATSTFSTDGSLTVRATTTVTALQAGSTAIGSSVVKISPLTGLTTSNSESVGGILNFNSGTTDALGFALYNNNTGTQRLLSLVCDQAGYGGNCLHVRSDGTTSAVNVAGAPTGQGLIKAGANGTGDADASILSLDASTSGFLGQLWFGKCGTATTCWNIRTSANAQVATMLGTGFFGLGTTSPFTMLGVDGTITANNINATSTSATSVFSGILQAVTGFIAPNSSNPTVSTTGNIAVNTTAASSSLRYHDGTAERALYDVIYKTVSVASSTLDAYQGQTSSSTIPIGVASPQGETWTEISCYTDAGTVEVEFGDGTNWMDYQSLTTSVSTDSSLSNNTFTSREKRFIRVGQASSLTTLSCTVGIRQDAS